MRNIILSIFIFASTTSMTIAEQLNAATLHTILVGDTTDQSLGTAFQTTVAKMHKEAEVISKETGLSLTQYVFIDQEARVHNVLSAVRALDIEEDDVVLVYMAIHGYRNPDKQNPWPSLYFGVENRGLDFHFLNQSILKKKPRLLLSIADSCNNYLDFNFPTVQEARTVHAPYSKQLIQSNYRRLFLDVKGSIIVSSSEPGEYSWAYPSYGGLWSLEFLSIFKNAVLTDQNPDWQTIMETTSSNIVRKRIEQKGAIQHAQYEVKLQKAVH